MTFGEQIKQRRDALNMTQEELAERLEVSRQAVSKWESGLSLPLGDNRAALCALLGLENPVPEPAKQHHALTIGGWTAAAVLLAALLGTWLLPGSNPSGEQTAPEPPAIHVRFYDENQEEVQAEALWYNTAKVDSLLIDWTQGTPDTAKLFFTPAGSETMEDTELLLTKSISDGNISLLLSADCLHRENLSGDLYIQLSFGDKDILVSDLYDVFYDPELL